MRPRGILFAVLRVPQPMILFFLFPYFDKTFITCTKQCQPETCLNNTLEAYNYIEAARTIEISLFINSTK